MVIYIYFFWIRGNLTSRKTHFVGSGERVKYRLSQTLIRGACSNSNSKPHVINAYTVKNQNINVYFLIFIGFLLSPEPPAFTV
jgi:hypothetical protein